MRNAECGMRSECGMRNVGCGVNGSMASLAKSVANVAASAIRHGSRVVRPFCPSPSFRPPRCAFRIHSALRTPHSALFLAVVCFLFPASGWAQNSRWGAGYFPNVELTTQDGKVVRFYDDLIKGKIVALDLIYTTCQYACPLETARLAQVQRLLGD